MIGWSFGRWCLAGEPVVLVSVDEEGPDEITSAAGGWVTGRDSAAGTVGSLLGAV